MGWVVELEPSQRSDECQGRRISLSGFVHLSIITQFSFIESQISVVRVSLITVGAPLWTDKKQYDEVVLYYFCDFFASCWTTNNFVGIVISIKIL